MTATTKLKMGTAAPSTSDGLFPAVRGEFYGYAAEFTPRRPLYVFMKCKSNKDRPFAFAAEHSQECNLVFQFDNGRILSIKAAQVAGFLDDDIIAEDFDDTWIAATSISADQFFGIRARKDDKKLVALTTAACNRQQTSTDLIPGIVYAAVSMAGKHCLFYVKDVNETSIQVEACHILI